MVVDCSVLSAVLFQEDTREDALSIMAGRTLHAPFLLGSEMASVALKKSRAGWPETSVENALAHFVQHDIEFHHPDVTAQYALALRYHLSAYDAAYLWVAGFVQAPLATFDAKLAKAARAYLARPA